MQTQSHGNLNIIKYGLINICVWTALWTRVWSFNKRFAKGATWCRICLNSFALVSPYCEEPKAIEKFKIKICLQLESNPQHLAWISAYVHLLTALKDAQLWLKVSHNNGIWIKSSHFNTRMFQIDYGLICSGNVLEKLIHNLDRHWYKVKQFQYTSYYHQFDTYITTWWF